MKKNAVKVLIFGLVLFFAKCANQLPPQGGEVDKTPPEIIDYSPANGTVNYHDNYIVLEFSEYVDKRSVQDAFFISPYIEGQPEFDWSGREVEIIFPDSLKTNTTYNVTIGTEVRDIHNNNKMIEPLNFSFSTGAKIDSGKISGTVYGNNIEGTMIFAYRLDAGKEINPLKNKPEYISQVADNGKFRLTGLAETSYRVFAIKDKFKDLLYNIGDDEYAVPFTDINLSGENNFKDLNFKLTREDTLKPYLLSAIMTDRNHIVVEFNEFIDSASVSAENFFIFDSSNSLKYPVKYFFKGKTQKYKYVVAIDSNLKKSDELFLNITGIPDKRGNVCEPQGIEFLYNPKPDTNYADILKIKTDYPDNLVDFFNPVLTVELTDGINRGKATSGISVTDDQKRKLKTETVFINDAELEIRLKQKLNFRKKYSLRINMNNLVDIAGNKLDSVYVFKFGCMNKLDYSGVSGKIIKAAGGKDSLIIVNLFPAEKGGKTYSVQTKNGEFEFENVYPGKYFLWYFVDSDSNRTYNYGKVYPFVPSERFNYYPDTLKLRPRWPVGDIAF